jgi:hypothetical protein
MVPCHLRNRIAAMPIDASIIAYKIICIQFLAEISFNAGSFPVLRLKAYPVCGALDSALAGRCDPADER